MTVAERLQSDLNKYRERIADLVRNKITESSDWFEMGALVSKIENTSFDLGRIYERCEGGEHD